MKLIEMPLIDISASDIRRRVHENLPIRFMVPKAVEEYISRSGVVPELTMSDKRLFLIDGSALAYRSYYAFAQNPLKTKRGEHTSVVYGFAATILRILSKEQPIASGSGSRQQRTDFPPEDVRGLQSQPSLNAGGDGGAVAKAG